MQMQHVPKSCLNAHVHVVWLKTTSSYEYVQTASIPHSFSLFVSRQTISGYHWNSVSLVVRSWVNVAVFILSHFKYA